MKKFLLLLLSLTLVFSCLVSCENNEGGGNSNDKIDAEKGTVEYVAAVVSTSEPTKIVTHVNYVGADTLSGIYTTEIDRTNGKTQFGFKYDRIAIPGEDLSDGYIKTEEGTVQFKDGQVLRAEGASWETLGEGYLTLSLTVTKSLFNTVELSEDGYTLTATVAPENTERVFGSAISANGDVSVEIKINEKYLYSVKISYVAKGTNANVTNETTYEYAPVIFDF